MVFFLSLNNEFFCRVALLWVDFQVDFQLWVVQGLWSGLWLELVGSGVIADGKWFDTKRSGFFHNFVLSV